ncbi:ATP-binding protein [Acuticoccus sp. I52.16.1]|uniref:ATP-binding protein n=1 Tax=Acuticoccus sp. I52.16.1 TaxID=2928472 RepID=UPI001FD0A16A|nr:ATP-binding protein [Acuticoccus sp. I52.16.1]UOM36907.1 ATP-binding protein [Acuticoccus sp. I52.16.1]
MVFHAAALALVLVAFVQVLRPRAARAALMAPVEETAGSPLTVDAKALLDTSPDACIVISDDATILWVNRAAREQMGIVSIGSPISFALRVPELVRAVERARRSGLSERARWAEKVPTRRYYEAFIAPLMLGGEGDERERVMTVYVHDLSEQQRLERMREDFVANASHELRTPLASLTGMIETLQGPARDDAKTREQFLALMREQADRMKRLTDSLLSLSRIEMRSHVRPTDIIDCAEITRYAVEMTRAIADDAEVTMELAIAEDVLPIRGDSDEIVQVMNNLIENAIKYGNEGGRVLVSATREDTVSGPVAAMAVQDFGKGIPPEHVPRLTERFYRVDIEESRARRGTGLGLAIVKHIINRHRGRLTVRSQLGAGSTFTVRIPLAETELPLA